MTYSKHLLKELQKAFPAWGIDAVRKHRNRSAYDIFGTPPKGEAWKTVFDKAAQISLAYDNERRLKPTAKLEEVK